MDFLSFREVAPSQIREIIDLGFKLKEERKKRIFTPYLENRTLAMIFEKSSTRTRVSFEVGIKELGGYGIFLSSRDIQLGRGEPLRDTARVLSRMVDMVMIRTYGHDRLEEFARYSSIPVINGLTDLCHPVQLLADLMTMIEYKKFNWDDPKTTKVAYVGDGNNMAHSWAVLAGKLGFELRIATPPEYQIDPQIREIAEKFARESGAKLLFTEDPEEAVRGANVVTTDTWISMGQEEEKEERVAKFKKYQVNHRLLKLAEEGAILLHCLPAYRGYEVTEELFEEFAKVIFDEAENRLHAQKGLMVWIGNQSWK
ncbi:MAG: ornithine carbamoyltransferase [Epsilonproteobacteria bacterium]|jgi:ornithine carbamoyltransferase|nr:ornithine carbamoyltransferase [Campylobacterota bacterium]NPA89820.1 ornithine carbamoyltransferase [Campylobacterota bacterium]